MKTLIEILRDYLPEAVYRSSGATSTPESFIHFYNDLIGKDLPSELSDKVLIISQEYIMDDDEMAEGDLIPVLFDTHTGGTYSPVFMSWEEVLKCPVSEESLEMHGAERSLFVILRDLSFWGTEERKAEQIRNAIAKIPFAAGFPGESAYALGTCASP